MPVRRGQRECWFPWELHKLEKKNAKLWKEKGRDDLRSYKVLDKERNLWVLILFILFIAFLLILTIIYN
jgi:uncharacterized membrane protein